MKRICFLSMIAALTAYAGGFYLTVDAAGKSTDPKAKGAFLTAKLTGCHEAEKGSLSASAEGIVQGKRQSIPLKLVKLDTPGTFAVARQWPEQGNWVVVLTATHPAFEKPTVTAVPVHDNTIESARAKYSNIGPLTNADVDQLLR